MKETKEDHAVAAIVISMPCFLWGLMIWMGLLNQNINLNRLNKFEGEVIERGITTRKAGRHNTSVFYVKIRGLDQILGIYRMNGDYSDLIERIKPQEIIKVYFKFGNQEEINIDLIQIEKAGQVILEANEFEKKESSLIYIGIGAIVVNIGFSIYYYWTKTGKS